MRVRIDPKLCQGHAQCAAAAPDLYLLDDNGYVLPIEGEIPAEQESDARAGERACPERAITVIDTDPDPDPESDAG